VTLWHAYHTGGSEEKALNQLLDQAKKDNPDAKITVLAVPFDQVFNKWETETAAGGGPDMLVAPNDSLGKEVRAGLLKPLDEQLKGKLDNVAPLAIQGMTVDGKLYAIPQLFKAVALYYNMDKVKSPPKTTDELMAAVKAGNKVVLNESAYHNFGFFGAFGGKLLDDSGKCVADQGGFVDALQYLIDLKAAGADFESDGSKQDTLFRSGQADMTINGPWVLGDYKGDLKDKLGVAPMPAGSKGKATPLTGVDGFYVNANTKNVEGAVALGLYLTSPTGQKVYADVAGDVPVRTDVSVSDPLVKAFADASATGFPRPQVKEMDAFWDPFGDAVTKSIEGKADPKAAVTQACSDMNKKNGH
jgi:arabinogalactan oligomer/maltooligosaccharide transport system substrate-binding protein